MPDQEAYLHYGQLPDPAAGAAWVTSILVSCHDLGRARSRQPAAMNIEEVDKFQLFRHIA